MDSKRWDALRAKIDAEGLIDPITGGRGVITSNPRRYGKSEAWARLLGMEGAKSRGPEFSRIWIDEAEDLEKSMAKEDRTHPEVQQALEKLAACMTASFEKDANTLPAVTLLSPSALTVSVPGKGYRKINHVGGEEFRPVRVTVGKTGKLIFVFKPLAAAVYAEMEMLEVDAQTQLEGFRQMANDACGSGNFVDAMRAIRQIETKAYEQEQVKEKAAVYEEFGSW